VNLRQAPSKFVSCEGCVRCGSRKGVVLCHYTGVRRQAYGGGYGIKVHDLMGAHLCQQCHLEMDTLSRDKARKWEHSEEFQHYVLMTILRLAGSGALKW
jgi:hypothetical protein